MTRCRLFSLNNIQITGGKIEFDDPAAWGTARHQRCHHCACLLSRACLQATEIFVEPAFSASIDGSPLIVQGRSKPFAKSIDSELAFDFRDVQLGRYLDYVPIRLPIQVVSGALDSDLKLSFRRQDDNQPAVALSGSLVIKDVAVRDSSGAPLLSLKRLDLLVGTLDPLSAAVRDRYVCQSIRPRFMRGSVGRERSTGSSFSARNSPLRVLLRRMRKHQIGLCRQSGHWAS
jgi:hypothetical protein